MEGCEVNGPDEPEEPDIGLPCGSDYAVIFRQGELLKRVKIVQAPETFLQEIRSLV